jgi:hypothetical protein
MIRKFILIAALLFDASARAEEALAPQSLGDALEQSHFDVNFRLRDEQVDDRGFTEDAAASTLRSPATWAACRSPAGIGFAKLRIEASYHQYRADSISAEYGDELDLVASYALRQMNGPLAKAARYRADQWDSDTNKFWPAVTFDI